MKDKKQVMLDELSKEPEMVIATAYLYAKNYVHYGEDVTKAWATAVQQNAILEKAYNNGYSDALKEREERKEGKWIKYEKEFTESGTYRQIKRPVIECSICQEKIAGYIGIMKYCPNCGSLMRGAENG